MFKTQSCAVFYFTHLFYLVSLYLPINASSQELTLFYIYVFCAAIKLSDLVSSH